MNLEANEYTGLFGYLIPKVGAVHTEVAIYASGYNDRDASLDECCKKGENLTLNLTFQQRVAAKNVVTRVVSNAACLICQESIIKRHFSTKNANYATKK